MRLYKLVLYDLKQGFFKPWSKLLPLTFLIVIAFLGANIYFLGQGVQMSSGDFLAYILEGSLPYTPNSETPFKIPLLWFLVQIYLFYYLGNYPTNDLKGMGQNILLKIASRKIWWFAKVCWCLLGSSLYMVLLILISLVFGVCNGNFSLFITEPFAAHMLFSKEFITLGTYQLVYILVLPWLVFVYMILLQLALNFIWRPLGSIFAIVAFYVAAAYYVSPWIPSEYSMLLRNRWMIVNGVSAYTGIPLLLISCFVLTIIGYITFSHYDILDDSKEI